MHIHVYGTYSIYYCHAVWYVHVVFHCALETKIDIIHVYMCVHRCSCMCLCVYVCLSSCVCMFFVYVCVCVCMNWALPVVVPRQCHCCVMVFWDTYQQVCFVVYAIMANSLHCLNVTVSFLDRLDVFKSTATDLLSVWLHVSGSCTNLLSHG